jgi:type VI secretion system secreted protein Hcp
MPIFMTYEGIEGSATAPKYDKGIDVQTLSWSWGPSMPGVSRRISTVTGRAANREVSAPTLSEVVITKEMDRASPQLLEQALVGQTGRMVTLTLTRTGRELEKYLEMKLYNTLISGYSVSASSSAAPGETWHLNFDKISWTVWPTKADGQAGEPITVGYDIGKATRM